MKSRLPLLLLSLLAAGASAADTKAPATIAPAAPTPGAASAAAPANGNAAARTPPPSIVPTETFEKFAIITNRNIFNTNRTPPRDRREAAPVPRTDVITLYGTADDDKGLRAFFDGSDAAYRKSLHAGESVDKFKVTKIEPKVIELERDGKTISVNVGQQLRRPEGADWTLATEVQPRAGLMASPARPDPNAPTEIPSGADEVTRRLMERRAKTLKN